MRRALARRIEVPLDFDPAVTAIVSQPFWLHWRDGAGRYRRHAPDLFARMAGGSGLVIDVRPDDRIEEKDAEAFEVTEFTGCPSDAVGRAQSVGIRAGNPIYFDMEGYARSSSVTKATLTFLAAWTSRLHALGYLSGVYSSSASGIADLASEIGTGYALPDDIWAAN